MPVKRLYIFLILFFGLFFVFVGLNKVYAATGQLCGCPSQCGQVVSCGSVLAPRNNNNCSATELCVATSGSGGICGIDYTGNCDTSIGTYGNPCKEDHSSLNISYSCNGGLYACSSSSGCRCMNSISECSSTNTLCTREGDYCCIDPNNRQRKYCDNSALTCCLTNEDSPYFEKCANLSSNPSACSSSSDFCGNSNQMCCLVGTGKDPCVSGLSCISGYCRSSEKDALPPAPSYSGPVIEPSKLLGSVGAILYPLGIGIGLFFIIKAGYEFMTSEGEPQKVKAAQEDLTSAVVGLIFIVLSTVILNIIINSLIGG